MLAQWKQIPGLLSISLVAIVGTALPHSSFGDPDCCGCLNGSIEGDRADTICNECSAVVLSVPAAELQQTFTEMEPNARYVQ